ncbi:MAG: hypothetical protein KKE55_07460, partial [Candidatus Omnitrophica bacterium]|nr:hypothetical protein [Candidatus Omnitrophota bacterium]
QTITNTLNLQGVSGNLITLRSTQENSAYTLNNLTSQTVTFIDVSDASAANPITANTSKNSGGNNANWAWTITYITWGGNASSNWGQGDNWQYGYVPNESDNVTIGNVTNSPVLGAARTINNLTINSGGVLDLAGNNFALTGSFQNYGILKLEGSETVTIPNMDINSGTVEYYGGGTYTTPLAAGDEYYNLTISGSGSFTAPSSLTINNIFTQTAGTFNASSNLYITNTFNRTAGTFNHNNGTVTFLANNSYTVTTGGVTFYNVVFNKSSYNDHSRTITLADDFTVANNLTVKNDYTSGYHYYVYGSSSPTITVLGNLDFPLTAQAGNVYFGNSSPNNNFTVNLAGNLTMSDTQAYAYARINLAGSGNQTLNQTAGTIYQISSSKTTGQIILGSNFTATTLIADTDTTFDINLATFNFTSAFNQSTGTFTLTPSGTGEITFNGFTQTAGTFNAPSGNLYITSTFNRTGGIFNHNNGTVTFLANNTYNITTGSATFYNVVFNKTAGSNPNTVYLYNDFTIANDLTVKNEHPSNYHYWVYGSSSPTITVNKNLSFPSTTQTGIVYFGNPSLSNNFTINLAGNFTLADTEVYMRANLTLDGSLDQILTQNLGIIDYGTWQPNKPSGNIILGSDVTIANFAITSSTATFSPSSYVFTVNNSFTQSGGTFNCSANTIILNGFTQSAGTFNAPSGNLYITNTFNRTGGTFNHSSGTITFLANNTYSITTAGVTFYNLVFNKTAGGNPNTIYLYNDFTVAGDLLVKNEHPSNYGYSVYGSSSPTITVAGNLNFPLTTQTGYVYFGHPSSANFTINLAGNFTLADSEAYMWANLKFNGSADQTITQSAGTIQYGTWRFNKALGNIILASSVAIYDLASSNNTSTFTSGSYTFTVNRYFTQTGGTFNAPANLTVNNSFTQSGGIFNGGSSTVTFYGFTQTAGTFNAPSGNLYITSTFNRTAGTFNHSNGTVTFLANNSYTVTTGGVTFYNVVFNKSSYNDHSRTITLADDFTVANNLTVKNDYTSGYHYY